MVLWNVPETRAPSGRGTVEAAQRLVASGGPGLVLAWLVKVAARSAGADCSSNVLFPESLCRLKNGIGCEGLPSSPVLLLHVARWWAGLAGDMSQVKSNCCYIARFFVGLFSARSWLTPDRSVQRWDGTVQFIVEGINNRNLSALTDTALNCHGTIPHLKVKWWMIIFFWEILLLPFSSFLDSVRFTVHPRWKYSKVF